MRGRTSRVLPSWWVGRWWTPAVVLGLDVVNLGLHFSDLHGYLRAHVVEMLLNLFAGLLQDSRDLYEGRLSLGGAGKHLREDLLVLCHALPELEDLLGHSLEARLDGVALGGFDLVQVVHVEVVSRDHLVNAVDAFL